MSDKCAIINGPIYKKKLSSTESLKCAQTYISWIDSPSSDTKSRYINIAINHPSLINHTFSQIIHDDPWPQLGIYTITLFIIKLIKWLRYQYWCVFDKKHLKNAKNLRLFQWTVVKNSFVDMWILHLCSFAQTRDCHNFKHLRNQEISCEKVLKKPFS